VFVPYLAQQRVQKKGVCDGCQVLCVFIVQASYSTFFRAVAFMDLGLLIIANLIMRTRLPPKARADKVSPLKEVILDFPYLLFVLGSFLVS
jgi:hypothetical protein